MKNAIFERWYWDKNITLLQPIYKLFKGNVLTV